MTPDKPDFDQPVTFAPPLSGRWREILLQHRHATVIALVLLFMVAPKAMAQEFKSAADCVVGKRVVTREKQAGVIVSADGSSCRVKLDATGKIDYNIFWMLRPEGTATNARSPAAAQAKTPGKADAGNAANLPTGIYKCYMLAGTTLNYAFVDIHITGANRYRDKSGKAGTFTIDDASRITFTGPLASANAKLLPGPRIGLNMNGGNLYNTSCSITR